MTDQTYTPGPWEVSKLAAPDYATENEVYSAETGDRVAHVFQSDANTNLISAAPAMLIALQWADEVFSDASSSTMTRTATIHEIRAAIAKAMGY